VTSRIPWVMSLRRRNFKFVYFLPCFLCHKPQFFDHVNIPLPIPPYTMQYPLLSNAADASHDGINLLVRVGDFPPTPGVPNSTINCHVPTDDDASNTRSFSGCPITALPRSNLRQHPLKHGIITSSFADLGRYSNQKGRFGCPTPPY